MSKPCMRLALGCSHCGARADEECPYEGMTEGLTERPATVQTLGGDCSGEDGVCESCQ